MGEGTRLLTSLVVLAAAVSACGGSEDDFVSEPSTPPLSATSPTPASTPSSGAPGFGFGFPRGVPVQFRVVVASTTQECSTTSPAACDLSSIDCEDPPLRVDPVEPVGLCDLAPPPDQQVAIVVGGRVVTAPTFSTPIVDGRAQISGDFTGDEARDLAGALRSGR